MRGNFCSDPVFLDTYLLEVVVADVVGDAGGEDGSCCDVFFFRHLLLRRLFQLAEAFSLAASVVKLRGRRVSEFRKELQLFLRLFFDNTDKIILFSPAVEFLQKTNLRTSWLPKYKQ